MTITYWLLIGLLGIVSSIIVAVAAGKRWILRALFGLGIAFALFAAGFMVLFGCSNM